MTTEHTITSSQSLLQDIHIRNLSLRFDALNLFQNLDLTLKAGEITCLLGPSGVGKSSLLRFLAGLEIDGQIEGAASFADGQTLSGHVAYLAQQDLLLPWLSVKENILLGARLRGEAPDEDKCKRLLTAVGLEDWARTRPAALSGGMRQRTALARTLMEDRPVVLMDEPFSALDALTKLQQQNLAAEMLADKTVLLITHDPMEAARLGQTIYVMSGTPATFSEPICPGETIPRKATAAGVLQTVAELLTLLGVDQLEGAAA